MNTNKTNGVIYYKLDERYDGDITKNCGLTGGEVDSNFFFLRGYDVENIEWDNDNRQLIFKRINGETIIVKGLDTPISAEKTYYDAENGTLILNINGVDYPISGFYVKEEQKFYTGNSVNGDGTIKDPIEVSETLKTGFFAPVESFIDLTITNNHLPSGVEYGTRFLTKENINKYGLLYNAEGLLKVQDILKNENSPWRVPSDKEWGEMLNALEELPEDRNHINTYSNKLCGSMAGPLMKKGSYEWVEIKRSQNLDSNTIEVTNLPEPSFIEYYECSEENKYYAVLDNPNTYIYYSCKNIWLNSNKVTPIYDVPQSCDFKVLPVGHAEVYNLTNKDSFRKQSAFWSSSEDENTDIWVREFAYDRDTVRRQAETVSDYFSIRLVRDYHSTVNKVENINGIPYETILMPYVEVDENGNIIKEGKKIWTSYNISIPSLLNYNEEGKYAVKPFNEKGEEIESDIVYFLNYWNGNSWEKRIFENNSMVIICNGPDGSKDEEWQLINGKLFKRSQEIISSLEKYTDKKISVLEEKHDSNINDLQDTHNEDINKITSLIEDYEAKTIESLTDLTEEIDNEIERATSKENELFINISNVDFKLNEEIAERININNTHNTQIDKLNQDIEVEIEERIKGDESLLEKINNVDSKLDEEVVKRGDDVLVLTNKVNEETKNRKEGDILLTNEITKNKIISIISNENSINTSIAENESGTTLYLDVELSDNDGCEFLHHTKGGLSDKGIKEYIRLIKEDIDSKHSEDIDEVKNIIVYVDDKVNERISNISDVNISEHETLKLNLNNIESDYKIADNALKEEVEDKITSTNTRVTTIESDYLTSLDKSELIDSNNKTIGKISEVEKNYLLADANLKDYFNQKLNILDEELKIRINSIDSDIVSVDGAHINVRTIQDNGVITSINVIENDIASAKDLSDLTKRIDTFFSDAAISAEAIDTLKEIQTYIDSDATAAAEMIVNIKAAKDAADNAQIEVDALEGVVATKAAQSDLTAHTGDDDIHVTTADKTKWNKVTEKAAQSDLDELAERVSTAEGEIDNLQTSLASGATAQAITAAQNAADKAQGDVDALETRVGAIENDYLKDADKTELEGKITTAQNAADAAQADVNALEMVVGTSFAADKTVASEIARIEGIADAAQTAEEVSDAIDEKIANLKDASHTHNNKTLLDSYTQTETDLADAVAKKHEHSNKTELDKIAEGDKAKWDKVTEKAAQSDLNELAERVSTAENVISGLTNDSHTHVNKELLDTYKQTEADLADAVAKKHEHNNKTELDKIAEGDKAKWDNATDAINAFLDDNAVSDNVVNTLKEIQEYITKDGSAAADMLDAIEAAQSAADAAQGDVDALETRVGAIENDYLKDADKTELEGKITTAQNAADAAQADVNALEMVVSGKADSSTVTTLNNTVTAHTGNTDIHVTVAEKGTFVKKSQIVNELGGSEDLIVSQKKINEEIDRLRSEIINSGTGGEVDLSPIYERFQKIESDIASINTKIGTGTIITTNNITEYIVTPTDDENIVISKTENGGISIKLVKIDNMNF